MIRIGAENKNVVVVNSDLMRSSRTQGFAVAYPDRTFNMGVAEQQMVSLAAGLVRKGFMQFCFSFASFISMRACEQVRTDVCHNGLPVRFLGNNIGYSTGTMGATQGTRRFRKVPSYI
jgi:transketolase